MTDIDAYFTQTIVGAPFSTVLGRRLAPQEAQALGVEVPLDGSAARLSAVWHDWLLLSPGVGAPSVRRQPTAARLVLERHALVIAAFGLLALGVAGLWVGLA